MFSIQNLVFTNIPKPGAAFCFTERIAGNAAVFDKPVPYLDLKDKQKYGFVDLIEVYYSGCLDCSGFSNIKKSLENAGVKINNYEKI